MAKIQYCEDCKAKLYDHEIDQGICDECDRDDDDMDDDDERELDEDADDWYQ